MKKFTLLIILTSSFYFMNAQTYDYEEIRDSICLFSCGSMSFEIISQSMENLEALDTNIIAKNIDSYYYDLALSYTFYYGHNKNKAYLYKSIEALEKAVNYKKEFAEAYWNLAMNYFYLNDCDNIKKYLDLYKLYQAEEYYDQEEADGLLEKCE